ncbi:MAG: hypothetical protein R3Y53_09450, partial [Bacillota bacterium]
QDGLDDTSLTEDKEAKLRADIADKEVEIDLKEVDIADKKQEIVDKEAEIDLKEAAIETAKTTDPLGTLLAEIEAKEAAIEENTAAIDTNAKAIVTATGEVEAAEDAYDAQKVVVEDKLLELYPDPAVPPTVDYDNLVTTSKNLFDKSGELEAEIIALEEAIAEEDRNITNLKTETNSATLENDISILEGAIEEAKAERDKLKDETNGTGSVYDLEEAITDQMAELETISAEINRLNPLVLQQEAVVAATEAEIAAIEAEILTLEEEIAVLNGQIEAEIKKLLGEDAEKYLEALAELAEVEDELLSKGEEKTEAEGLRDDLAAAEADLADAEVNGGVSSSTDKTTAEIEADIVDLKAKIVELLPLLDSTDDIEAYISALGNEITALETEITDLEAEKTALETTISDLEISSEDADRIVALEAYLQLSAQYPLLEAYVDLRLEQQQLHVDWAEIEISLLEVEKEEADYYGRILWYNELYNEQTQIITMSKIMYNMRMALADEVELEADVYNTAMAIALADRAAAEAKIDEIDELLIPLEEDAAAKKLIYENKLLTENFQISIRNDLIAERQEAEAEVERLEALLAQNTTVDPDDPEAEVEKVGLNFVMQYTDTNGAYLFEDLPIVDKNALATEVVPFEYRAMMWLNSDDEIVRVKVGEDEDIDSDYGFLSAMAFGEQEMENYEVAYKQLTVTEPFTFLEKEDNPISQLAGWYNLTASSPNLLKIQDAGILSEDIYVKIGGFTWYDLIYEAPEEEEEETIFESIATFFTDLFTASSGVQKPEPVDGESNGVYEPEEGEIPLSGLDVFLYRFDETKDTTYYEVYQKEDEEGNIYYEYSFEATGESTGLWVGTTDFEGEVTKKIGSDGHYEFLVPVYDENKNPINYRVLFYQSAKVRTWAPLTLATYDVPYDNNNTLDSERFFEVREDELLNDVVAGAVVETGEYAPLYQAVKKEDTAVALLTAETDENYVAPDDFGEIYGMFVGYQNAGLSSQFDLFGHANDLTEPEDSDDSASAGGSDEVMSTALAITDADADAGEESKLIPKDDMTINAAISILRSDLQIPEPEPEEEDPPVDPPPTTEPDPEEEEEEEEEEDDEPEPEPEPDPEPEPEPDPEPDPDPESDPDPDSDPSPGTGTDPNPSSPDDPYNPELPDPLLPPGVVPPTPVIPPPYDVKRTDEDTDDEWDWDDTSRKDIIEMGGMVTDVMIAIALFIFGTLFLALDRKKRKKRNKK